MQGDLDEDGGSPAPGRRARMARAMRGAGGMVASSIAFALMNYLAKSVSGRVPSSEITFARFLTGTISLGLLGRLGVVEIRAKKPRMLLLRAALGATAILLLFASIATTRLTNAILLGNTYVLFGALFSRVLLGEGVGGSIALALAGAVAGSALLSCPRLSCCDAGTIRLGDMLAIAQAVIGGMAITVVRSLRRTGQESPWAILFYLSWVGTLAGLAASMAYERGRWVVPGGPVLAGLVGVGIFGTLGQGLMTYAYGWCRTAEGGVLSLLAVPLTAALAVTLIGERLSAWDLAGGALVLGSCVMAIVRD